MRALIISAGEFSKVKLKHKYDLIIACDKGYTYAKKLKINHDIVMGDFDSSKIPKNGSFSIIKFDTMKDDTDTALAVSYALRNGYKNIDIICALGKRIDHALANIYLLKYIYENGGNGAILSSDTYITAVGEGLTKIANDKKYNTLSLFSLSKKTKIKYIKGTKYDCKNIVVKEGMTLGVSNEFTDKEALINVEKGILLIVACK